MVKEESSSPLDEALEEVEALETNNYQKLSDETLIEIYTRHMFSLNHPPQTMPMEEFTQHQRAKLTIEAILISRDNEFTYPEDVSGQAYEMLYPDGDPTKPNPALRPVEYYSGPSFNYL